MKITIDNRFELQPSISDATRIKSRWTPNKTIHGYQFHLQVTRQSDYDFVQDKLVNLSVTVEGDDREYVVTDVQMQRSSSTNGKLVDADFVVIISEADLKPSFSEIEVNGLMLQVLDYKVFPSDDSTVHSFLLNLDKTSFCELEHKFEAESDALCVQRIGVDEVPFACRIGGANYWSSQVDSNGEHFCRIINCVIDHKPPRISTGGPSLVRCRNLERKVSQLEMQIEYLLQRLANTLNSNDLEILGSVEQLEKAVGSTEYWTGLDRTRNAREWFEEE